MELQLRVDKSTKTENGNFCNKLIAEQQVHTPFGASTTRQTFYLFTDQENKVGTVGALDMAHFDVVESEYQPEGSDEIIILKKLYPKR